ncbi:MAG: cobalt-precorrin-5B (C(1))-methyltransferase CbiD [Firmicutes bacterium]|nr:cobalt-precorrin-5B (C(1))-methyltransferase CbiD [Bacillota bacterium]
MLPTYQQVDGTMLRAGFTTGTTAAAAAKAATYLLHHRQNMTEIELDIPAGFHLTLPLVLVEQKDGFVRVGIRKDAGDDPDVTHQALIIAEARPGQAEKITLLGGEGVGRVTKPGLAVPVGDYAINPGPRAQILAAVQSVLPPDSGVTITITVPEGRQLAKRTLNAQLGIVGGISILGTTGIVEPMSADAFKRSLLPQIDVALAAGIRRLVLTPGKMGKSNALSHLPVVEDAVVVTSNFIGYMLKACAAKGIEEVLLYGHIGKLVKVAAGITETHSSIADARRETLVAHAALLDVPKNALVELMSHNTAEESAAYLQEHGYQAVLTAVATAAARRAEKIAGGSLQVGCILLNLASVIIAQDERSHQWCEVNSYE